jgi:hypothetical protein
MQVAIYNDTGIIRCYTVECNYNMGRCTTITATSTTSTATSATSTTTTTTVAVTSVLYRFINPKPAAAGEGAQRCASPPEVWKGQLPHYTGSHLHFRTEFPDDISSPSLSEAASPPPPPPHHLTPPSHRPHF